MYAYITLKFEITPDDMKRTLLREIAWPNSDEIPAQIAAEEIAECALNKSEADDIVKVEVKDD